MISIHNANKMILHIENVFKRRAFQKVYLTDVTQAKEAVNGDENELQQTESPSKKRPAFHTNAVKMESKMYDNSMLKEEDVRSPKALKSRMSHSKHKKGKFKWE